MYSESGLCGMPAGSVSRPAAAKLGIRDSLGPTWRISTKPASVEAWLADNRPSGLTVVSLGKEPLEVPIEVPA